MKPTLKTVIIDKQEHLEVDIPGDVNEFVIRQGGKWRLPSGALTQPRYYYLVWSPWMNLKTRKYQTVEKAVKEAANIYKIILRDKARDMRKLHREMVDTIKGGSTLEKQL